MLQVAPRIAVLILGFNESDHIVTAINSVFNQDYKNYEIIYIDNASSNQSLELVQTHFPAIKTIAHRKNLGYAGAYAKVLVDIFAKDFDAAVLLNSDVEVDKRWLSELVHSAYKDERIGFVQPKIFLWTDKKLANTFGNEIHYLGFGFCGHYKMPDNPQYVEDKDITYASGASIFIKREAYLDIGGIDADFFAYLEDQDLAWRGHLRGWRSVLSARSIMWHKYVFKSPTRSQWKFHIYERNRFFFIIKNYSTKLIILILPMFLIMELGMFLDALRNGYFFDKVRAYTDTLFLLPQLLQKRKNIQNKRLINDRELLHFLAAQITFKELKNPLLDSANILFKVYYYCIKLML